MEIGDYRYFFFDLDKTLWNWDSTIIGAEDLIDTLRENNKEVYFHTDNTLLSREQYAKKLTSMGIPAEKEDVITSGYVAARYLARNDVTKTYFMGETGLTDELEEEEISIAENADTVIQGFDRQFNYNKAKKTYKILEEDGELIVCSTEKDFRTSEKTIPHQGRFNPVFEGFNSTVAGKPSEQFRTVFRNYFNYMPNTSMFIGDRFADIETGNRLGMTTAAVMSGELTREKLAKAEEAQEPDFGLSSLNKLKKRII